MWTATHRAFPALPCVGPRRFTPGGGAIRPALTKFHFSFALSLALNLGGALSGAALAAPANGRFAVEVWTTDEGLPQNSVLAVTQTRDGYLWLGTLNGLARFDGVRFKVFDENNTPELKSSKVVRLFEDSAENLWIGTESGGIFLLARNGRLSSATMDPRRESTGGKVSAIAEDAAGAVWLYTMDGGLARYRDKQMSVWGAAGAASSRTRALATEKAGFVWVRTDYGLTGLGPVPLAGTALPAAFGGPGKVDYLVSGRFGGYWRFIDGRIQKCETNRVDRDFGPYPWRTNVMVSAACEDQEGNLVVGTYGEPGDGVYWFDATGAYERIRGLSHNSILSLTVDREGSLWVGTDGGGLNRVKRQVFGVLEPSRGATAQSVCDDGAGGLWVGYNSERVDHYSRASGTEPERFTVNSPGTPLAVRSVFADTAGMVWAGTYGAGLFRFQGKEFLRLTEFQEVANPRVSSLYQDRQGRLWVGTQGGLAYLEGGNWRTFGSLDGLCGNLVVAVAEDSAGTLWVGTDDGGLNRIQNRQVTAIGRTNGLPSNSVSSILIDKQDVLWVGTSGGLARYDGKHWTTYTTLDGLAANGICFLLAEGEEWLWLGSRAGLMRAPKKELNDFASGRLDRVSVRTYGKEDGLPTRECTQGSQPAACQTRDGLVWFPTIKGVAYVNPSNLHVNTNPPPVIIESVLVDGQPQETNGLRSQPPASLVLPAKKKALDLQFTSLSLGAPAQTRFKYRLEGHDPAWTEGSGNQGTAHYTRLPAGDYVFRVKACNEDQVWNDAGSTLAVTVLPPFWQTWWFLTATTLALLGLVAGSVHYVSTQRLQQQLASLKQQEALEQERARIARDLHDQLGANLTQVALLGELAEADKELPAEVESHARQIANTARETTRALDEIVWTVNPANDTLDGLINYTCKYAQEYLALAGLKYRLEVPPRLPALPITPEMRHNVFLAAKEAVNNVVKHSGAESAWVRLLLNPDGFVLEIEDDGRGLKGGEEGLGRNGLKNMRKRMEDVGGGFSIEPAANGGTVVKLTVHVGCDGSASAQTEAGACPPGALPTS